MAAPPPRLAAQCGYLRPVLVSPSASDRRIRKRHSVCKSEHMLMHKALATQRTGSYRFALRCPRKAPVNHSNPPDIIAHPTPTHTSSVSRHKALALGLCPASFSAPYYTVHLHICTGVLSFLIGAITSPPCSCVQDHRPGKTIVGKVHERPVASTEPDIMHRYFCLIRGISYRTPSTVITQQSARCA